MLEDFDGSRLVQPLLSWFASHARTLPWREDVSPYRVWVSEIMLQQTRVEAVIPYYERFLQTLPDVESLAASPEDLLLKLWEGLGYYNRVRNMQKAARMILRDFHGRFPEDPDELQKLPGIGSYTAGAISSIAFGYPAPAVDGNVLRILMRVAGDDSDIAKESVKKRVNAYLQALMLQVFAGSGDAPAVSVRFADDACGAGGAASETLHFAGGSGGAASETLHFAGGSGGAASETQHFAGGSGGAASETQHFAGGAGAFNQALMDLGATVCTPNGAALCDRCPWQQFCLACANGKTDVLPVKSGAKPRRIEDRTILLIERGEEILLHRRPEKGLLAGLYEFPNIVGRLTAKEALRHTDGLGLHALYIEPLPDAVHVFSHVEWHMCGYRIRTDALDTGGVSDMLFVPVPETRERYAIPSAFAAYKKLLNI